LFIQTNDFFRNEEIMVGKRGMREEEQNEKIQVLTASTSNHPKSKHRKHWTEIRCQQTITTQNIRLTNHEDTPDANHRTHSIFLLLKVYIDRKEEVNFSL